MKDIAIQGLSPKQMAFADIMWGLQSANAINEFMQALPKRDRQEAELVKQMMLLAFIDQVETVETAKKVLAQFKL